MTSPDTIAKPNIPLDRRAPSRQDSALAVILIAQFIALPCLDWWRLHLFARVNIRLPYG